MAANPIYVETEEEIPEVVERLRRTSGEDSMLVLPARSRVGQSRFNFQLLRNYASRMGKRVTIVCDDPAVQKMAKETGFPVFGTVGPAGEGIPAVAPPPPPARKWWQRKGSALTPHIGVVAPTRLITKTATELKPGRFLLYMAMLMITLVGLSALAVFVPSAQVTLIAQAAPFSQRDVEIQAEPGKAPIHVRVSVVSRTDSQGFKTTGVKSVPLAPSTGTVTYTNNLSQPRCPSPDCGSPGLIFPRGQRLKDTKDSIEFAQISGNTLVPWRGTASASVQAVLPGTVGNVGDHVINSIEDLVYDPSKVTVTNPQATAGGTDPSSAPQMQE